MAKSDIKKTLKEPDEFITFADKAAKWAQTNMKLLTIIGVVLVLIIGAAVGISQYIKSRDAEATTVLGPVVTAYEQFLGGKLDSEATQTMQEALELIASQYGATPAGMQARLIMGDVLYRRGEYKKAAAELGSLSEDTALASELLPLALHGRGQALEAQDLYADAAASYKSAIAAAGPNLAQMYKVDLARVLAAQGDVAGAKAIYEEELKKTTDPTRRQTLTAIMSRLLEQGAPAAATAQATEAATAEATQAATAEPAETEAAPAKPADKK